MSRSRAVQRARVGGGRREQVQAALELRTKAGLTLRELSRQTGIPISTITWWSRRLKRERFVEIETSAAAVDDLEQQDGRLELVLLSGYRVMVPAAFNAEALRRLIAIVEESC